MKKNKFIILIIPVLVIMLLFACADADAPEAAVPEKPSIAEPSDLPTETPPSVSVHEPDPSDNEEPDIPEPEEPADPVAEKIADIIDSMTLHEKICQMLIVTPDSLTGVSEPTVAGEITKDALEKHPVGGIIHFPPNIISSEQISLFNSNLQDLSEIPLLIAVDEEGGRVARLRSKLGAHSVRAMLTYEDEGEDAAFENAVILSDALKSHGFNTNFAPVADVWSNPSNRVIGDRAYSTDFSTAAKLVAAAVRGFNESNIACSVKHFPGHGNTQEDSHHRTAFVNKTLDELREEEFIPFIAGIEAGADMVMTGHLIVPEVDELPATLSRILITDILRDELGFEGVVITDSLAMNAISGHFDPEFVAVTAIGAGVDIILMPAGIDETVSALLAAVESGKISESRIDESVGRILRVKISIGLM